MSTRSLPPFPRGDDWRAWALQMVEHLRNRDLSRAEVVPQSILLEHQITGTLPKALTDGVVMYNPVTNRPVYSRDGVWVSFASAVGIGVNFDYEWTTTTAGAVPTGQYGVNNSDVTIATTVRVSGTSRGGFDITAFWASVDTGDFMIFQEDTGNAEWNVYTATGPSVAVPGSPAHYEIPVSHLGSLGTPENNRRGVVSYVHNPDDRLPTNGNAGEYLRKVSTTDYDTEWAPFIIGYGGIRRTNTQNLGDIGGGLLNWEILLANGNVLANPVGVNQQTGSNSLSLNVEGVWSVSVSFSLTHNEINSSRTFNVRLFDIDGAVGGVETIVGVGRNTDTTTFASTFLIDVFTADVGDDWRVEVGGTLDDITNVTLNSYSFSVNMVPQIGA